MASTALWILSQFIISMSIFNYNMFGTDCFSFPSTLMLRALHSHQTIKKDEFYALLSVADLALITPLRDGMNTTSMEYIICQDKTHKSPLVLSEFMGISPNLSQAL